MARGWTGLCVLAMVACAPTGEGGADSDVQESDLQTGEEADPFADVTPQPHYFARAADVAWTDLSGNRVSLSQVWSPGSTVILRFFTESAQDRSVMEGDVSALIDASPKNVRYVFGAYGTPAQRREKLTALQQRIKQAVAKLGPKRQEAWVDRFWLVDQAPEKLGWLSELGAPNPRRTDSAHAGKRFIGAAIDPQQAIRPLGELVDWATQRTRLDWLAHDAVFYALQANLDQRMSEDGAVEVTLFEDAHSGSGWDGPGLDVSVEIPDLSRFERAELVLDMKCFEVEQTDEANGRFAGDLDCPEWDRITSLKLCDDTDQSRCDVEIGRWITPYTREGQFVTDISPLLPLLSAGTHTFRYTAIDDHKITLKLRLIDDDTAPKPLAAVPLFTGGPLTADTPAPTASLDVTIPANATHVEVAALITGHSFATDTKNCAEFCNHEHHFAIGSQEVVDANPQAGSAYGCEQRVAEGVIPNQYGSWPFGRGGWCPGSAVALFRGDLSDVAHPASTVSVSYRVTVDGAPYAPIWLDPTDTSKRYAGEGIPPGIWVPEIVMSSWLVSYAAPEVAGR